MLTNVKEMLEAMRGKTVIEKVVIEVEDVLPVSIDALRGLMALPLPTMHACPDGRVSRREELVTERGFLSYVSWSYYYQIVQRVGGGEVKDIRIHGRYLFNGPEKGFSIRFQPKIVTFFGRKNMDDTLFLDLERYCNHHKLDYQVI